MGYEDLPRVSLINLPTPLEELHRLRQAIGGPRILLKRDDLTGLGLGGNKSRKLEFLLGDALRRGADAIITSGGIQTNHGRLTAAACAKLGLACYLVFTEDENGVYEGNRILQTMFGAKQVFCDNIDHSLPPEKMAKERLRAGEETIAKLAGRLRAQGKNPYVNPARRTLALWHGQLCRGHGRGQGAAGGEEPARGLHPRALRHVLDHDGHLAGQPRQRPRC